MIPFLLLTIAVGLVRADLTIYCKQNAGEGADIFGGLQEFKGCVDCECYVFELLCIEWQDSSIKESFLLYSRSLEYAKTCEQCACNSNQVAWANQQKFTDGLPDTTMIYIAPYEVL